MIQTHQTLLFVRRISNFLQFFNSRGGAYSILLGNVREGCLLGQGHLLGRIRYVDQAISSLFTYMYDTNKICHDAAQ